MDPESLLPLPLATFRILLALIDDNHHGYAIIGDIKGRTEGKTRLSAGTLYRSIQRMVRQELIVETDERPAPENVVATAVSLPSAAEPQRLKASAFRHR